MGKTITGKAIGAPDFTRVLRQVIYPIRSDKAVHFTGSIAQNGVEKESIGTLRSNRVRITKTVIQADQALHFQLLLYSTADFDESDLDNDKLIGSMELDLSRYGYQQSTSQYRLDLNKDIDYIDEDESLKIHCVLKNLSATAKAGGDTGEVVIEFLCEARA